MRDIIRHGFVQCCLCTMFIWYAECPIFRDWNIYFNWSDKLQLGGDAMDWQFQTCCMQSLLTDHLGSQILNNNCCDRIYWIITINVPYQWNVMGYSYQMAAFKLLLKNTIMVMIFRESSWYERSLRFTEDCVSLS